MDNIIKTIFGGFAIILVCISIHSCATRDTSYCEYEITGIRYYIVANEHGTFTKKTDYVERIEVFYNNTKIDRLLNYVKISDKTFVRDYANGWDETEIYMTQEDYENALMTTLGVKQH